MNGGVVHCCHFVTAVILSLLFTAPILSLLFTAAILSLLFTAVIIHVTNLELCIKVTMCSTMHTGTFSSHQNSIPATSPSSTQPSHLPLIPSLLSHLSPLPIPLPHPSDKAEYCGAAERQETKDIHFCRDPCPERCVHLPSQACLCTDCGGGQAWPGGMPDVSSSIFRANIVINLLPGPPSSLY